MHKVQPVHGPLAYSANLDQLRPDRDSDNISSQTTFRPYFTMPEPTTNIPGLPTTTMMPRRLITKERAPSFFAGLKTRDYREPRHASTAIRAIAWNNIGNRIACALQDRVVRVWNPDKPETRHSTELKGHTGVVEKVCWDPTHPDRLASGGHDGLVKFWDVRSE